MDNEQEKILPDIVPIARKRQKELAAPPDTQQEIQKSEIKKEAEKTAIKRRGRPPGTQAKKPRIAIKSKGIPATEGGNPLNAEAAIAPASEYRDSSNMTTKDIDDLKGYLQALRGMKWYMENRRYSHWKL